jgi:hypothetical protein
MISLAGMLVAGLLQFGAPASPPPLLLPLLEPEPPPLPSPRPRPPLLPLLVTPLLEPVASFSTPLLEPLPPPVPPPLLLLQPEAKEKHAATERIEEVIRMRRSMVWSSLWDFWALFTHVGSVNALHRHYGERSIHPCWKQ